MKLSKLSIYLVGAALLLSSSAFAKEKTKGTLNISDPVTLEGKTINPGQYTVEWSGTGPTVQVTFYQGKQVVATFSAHLTDKANRNARNAYGTTAEADGSKSLTAIYLSGNKSFLEVEQQQAGRQTPSNPAQ
jgi:hypothetical protein